MIANLQERKISVPPSAPTPTTPHPLSFLGHLTGTTSQSAGPDTGGWQCPAPTPRPAHPQRTAADKHVFLNPAGLAGRGHR